MVLKPRRELTIVDFLDLRTVCSIVDSKTGVGAVLVSYLSYGSNAQGERRNR
jgi:hypothetical protein